MIDHLITRRGTLAGLVTAGVLTGIPHALLAQPRETTGAVETSTGKVRGFRDRGVSIFLGVPYGGDTSVRRFRAPLAAPAWTGVKDCFALGHQAPQLDPRAGIPPVGGFVAEMSAATLEGMEIGNQGEDCLVLNVYTPEASPHRQRPVMVWLHGGGFVIGSAGDPQYAGDALARRGDVVVVTINHRLNALGYLYLGDLHDDFAESGNVGQLDILLALRWVRDNIGAFGGDAGNVTIFGESGGARKVSVMMAMPAARGLFHKAIVQSGAGLEMTPKQIAAERAEQTLATLGIARGDVHKLETMDRVKIMQAAGAAMAPGRPALGPVVDGRVLPRHPFEPDAPETARGIPVMVGTTATEDTLFLAGDPLFGTMTKQQAAERAKASLGGKGEAAIEFYSKLRPDDAPTYWLAAAATDGIRWIDSVRLAERKYAQAAGGVYMYRLDWRTPKLQGRLRSPHGLDVALAFDNVATRPLLIGKGPVQDRLAREMSSAWINFARNGNPSQAGLAWPAYDTQSRQTMIFDAKSRVVADPDSAARQFWAA